MEALLALALWARTSQARSGRRRHTSAALKARHGTLGARLNASSERLLVRGVGVQEEQKPKRFGPGLLGWFRTPASANERRSRQSPQTVKYFPAPVRKGAKERRGIAEAFLQIEFPQVEFCVDAFEAERALLASRPSLSFHSPRCAPPLSPPPSLLLSLPELCSSLGLAQGVKTRLDPPPPRPIALPLPFSS